MERTIEGAQTIINSFFFRVFFFSTWTPATKKNDLIAPKWRLSVSGARDTIYIHIFGVKRIQNTLNN